MNMRQRSRDLEYYPCMLSLHDCAAANHASSYRQTTAPGSYAAQHHIVWGQGGVKLMGHGRMHATKVKRSATPARRTSCNSKAD
eukprot:352965-Chlamydomonas_euryale.AAC.10